MEQAADILKTVQTPLQLAAIALLVLYGIAKALIGTGHWTPSAAVTRSFLNRAFALGLVALVLAVGGPLVVNGLDRDDLIDGSVTGPDGSPIGSATVSAPPVGRQPVHLDGSFELRVPDHLKRPRYVVTAAAEGYANAVRTVDKAAIGSVDFQLKAQPVHTVRAISPNLVVGQFYGVPFLIVSMQAQSPGSTMSWISAVTATLSNGTATISLFPKFVTTLSYAGPYVAVTGMFPVNPGVETTVRVVLAPNADVNGLVRTVSSLPDYRDSAPCMPTGSGSLRPLTDQAYGLVQAFAKSRFVWTGGDWTLRFRVTAGGQEDALDKTFALSPTDVARLWDSVSLIRSCLSVVGNAPLAQDGVTSNYLFR